MYYGMAVTLFAGIQGTPITSLLSKCVDTSEFGKVWGAFINDVTQRGERGFTLL